MAGRGRPGPAPLPNERHRKLGNPSKKPLPRGNVIALAPAALPVVGVGTPGDDLVRGILDSAASAWIAAPDRLALLELLREGWNERAHLRAAVAALPPDWVAGRYQPACVLRLAQVEKDLTGWLSQLGLTPSDRSRLGVAEVRARSRLEELRDRRAARGRAG